MKKLLIHLLLFIIIWCIIFSPIYFIPDSYIYTFKNVKQNEYSLWFEVWAYITYGLCGILGANAVDTYLVKPILNKIFK